MSTNGTGVDDTEIAECDGEKVVTMMDVLQEQQEFEEDANAVLGASDDKNCTYSKGYIKRQAVYACLTCCGDAKLDPEKRAGVCLACSLTCHENHDLVELYTKRNFCCDCGNPKFKNPCQYSANKTVLNEDNIYNQNFSGLYCVCHRPYPDPDGVEEEMIQCIVCEDWLHASHLDATVPSSELYAEMICKACMEKNEFLHDYSKYAVNGDVDVMDTSEIRDNSIQCNGNASEINGVDEKIQSDQVVSAESDAEVKKDTDPTQSSTNNTDENKSEEQLEPIPMDSVIEEYNDSEKPIEENHVKDAIENDKPTENLNKDLKSDNTEGTTTVEIKENESNDTTEKNISSNEISESKPSDSTDESNEPLVSTEVKNECTINNQDIKSTDHIDSNSSENNALLDPQNEVTSNLESNAILNPENDAVSNPEKDAVSSPEKDAVLNPEKDAENEKVQEKETGDAVQIQNQKEPIDSTPIVGANSIEMDISLQVPTNHTNQEDEKINENKRKLSTMESTDDVSVKKAKVTNCFRPRGEKKIFKGATFWPCLFRQKLCTCSECITMYKDLSVLFLIDPDDTVTAYELLGKEKSDGTATTQYEKGLEALSSLGRIQQINALTEYNKMKDKLLDFLKSFKDRKEVVKEEDIKAFFAGMKPKREPDGVYFCR